MRYLLCPIFQAMHDLYEIYHSPTFTGIKSWRHLHIPLLAYLRMTLKFVIAGPFFFFFLNQSEVENPLPILMSLVENAPNIINARS